MTPKSTGARGARDPVRLHLLDVPSSLDARARRDAMRAPCSGVCGAGAEPKTGASLGRLIGPEVADGDVRRLASSGA
jgi:hypothetical protein